MFALGLLQEFRRAIDLAFDNASAWTRGLSHRPRGPAESTAKQSNRISLDWCGVRPTERLLLSRRRPFILLKNNIFCADSRSLTSVYDLTQLRQKWLIETPHYIFIPRKFRESSLGRDLFF